MLFVIKHITLRFCKCEAARKPERFFEMLFAINHLPIRFYKCEAAGKPERFFEMLFCPHFNEEKDHQCALKTQKPVSQLSQS